MTRPATDHTLCTDHACSLKGSCWRYVATGTRVTAFQSIQHTFRLNEADVLCNFYKINEQEEAVR